MRKSVIPFLFKKKLSRKLIVIQLAGALVPVSITGVVLSTIPGLSIPALCLSVIVTLFGILYYLNLKITIPLHAMETTAKKLAAGNLSETMPEDALGEISRISYHINEFSINQQEMLLHFWNQSVDTIKELDAVVSELKTTNNANIRKLQRLLTGLRKNHAMIETFSYFDVQMSDDKAVAITDTYQGDHNE